jgi:hypothetical protein
MNRNLQTKGGEMKPNKTKGIMALRWRDEGDGEDEFTAENIGMGDKADRVEIASRLNSAAAYLVKTYNIDIVEARNRLWNQGDFYPRLEMVEEEK